MAFSLLPRLPRPRSSAQARAWNKKCLVVFERVPPAWVIRCGYLDSVARTLMRRVVYSGRWSNQIESSRHKENSTASIAIGRCFLEPTAVRNCGVDVAPGLKAFHT